MASASRSQVSLIGGLLLVGSTGCATSPPSELLFHVRPMTGISTEAAFGLGERALTSLGYAIDLSDLDSGRLTTVPILSSGRGEPASSGTNLGRPVAVRRIAEFRVHPMGDSVRVYCRVVVQQRLVGAERMYLRQAPISDLPGETPIERGAATTGKQNEVWRTVRRDKVRERQIMDALIDLAEPVIPPPVR